MGRVLPTTRRLYRLLTITVIFCVLSLGYYSLARKPVLPVGTSILQRKYSLLWKYARSSNGTGGGT